MKPSSRVRSVKADTILMSCSRRTISTLFKQSINAKVAMNFQSIAMAATNIMDAQSAHPLTGQSTTRKDASNAYTIGNALDFNNKIKAEL